MLTHPHHGGYPHPDHIAVHEIALAAWRAAADPDFRPDLGPAWAATKLYCRVFPQSFFESNPAFAHFRIALNGQQMAFQGTPDNEINAVLDVAAWVDQRMAGWDCHQSQHNPQGMWSGVSDEVRRAFAIREHLLLIAHRLPAAPLHESNLWSGVEPAVTDDIEAADELAGDVDPASAAAGERLLAALRSRRTYLMIYQDYLKRSPKAEFVELLTTLNEHTQEAIALLSRSLRQIDRNPKLAGVNEKLLAQGVGRRVAAGKLNFIIVGSAKNLDWYAQQLGQDDPPAIKAVWQALIELETQDQQLAKDLLAEIEHAASQVSGAFQV
jgi:hypothetical protein